MASNDGEQSRVENPTDGVNFGSANAVTIGGDVVGDIIADDRGLVLNTAGGAYVEGNVSIESGDFVGRDKVSEIFVPYDVAYERVIGSNAFVLRQLEASYLRTREQSQGWFRFSLIAATIGFGLIGVGVVTVILGQTTAGLITAIASVVPNAAAALFFVQARAANARVDSILSRLTDSREIQVAVEIANTIDDPNARDKLKAEIVRKALRVEQKRSQ